MAYPLAAMHASLKASERVGWAWQVLATSSEEAPYSKASTASAIISPAFGPITQAPRILSECLSVRILTIPSASLLHLALLLAINGNVPTLYSIPSAFNYSSDLPTLATSG